MPGFELSDDNAAAIARICRALDGLPLAIELAAARIRVLGPDGMAQRIGERLALLTRRAPDLAERQRSLRATIEWSVRLLDEPARAAFGAVGVFAAPASLASIERVVGDVVADVPGAMEALLDASLVISEARFLGRATLSDARDDSDYAVADLGASGAESETRDRHLADVVDTVSRWDASRRGDPNDRGDLAIVDAIYPDVVAAAPPRNCDERGGARVPASRGDLALLAMAGVRRGRASPSRCGNRVGRPASSSAGSSKRVAGRVGDRVDPRRPASRGLARRASCDLVRRGRRAAARGEGPGPARVDRERQR